MSFLKFEYDLDLTFDSPVFDHCFILRCLPLYDDSQKSDGVRSEIAPYSRLWEHDGAIMGDVRFKHDSFHVRVAGRVFETEGGDRTPPHPVFSHFTRATAPDKKLKEIAAKFQGQKRDYLLACKVMDEVHNLLVYTPTATGADTDAAHALSLGKGVCQDYSHIFCAVMRLLGVPTRYVAGLNYGCGATHAWNECYIDGCWRAFDCTNDKPAADGYVKFCSGVDAEQCALNRGVFCSASGGEVNQRQNVRAVVEYAF